ncbi:MAG: hypothetical protein JWM95_1357 [Gemmatimonadetes bacterium]|nr:hypothetical protein [Gemmatimonadota bacterium]
MEAARASETDPVRLAKVTTSARLIAQAVTGRKSNMAEVGIGHLLWDSAGRRWAILPKVEQWSRELRPGSSDDTREAHRLYAGALLDAGAAAGLLTRGTVSVAAARAETVDIAPLLSELTAAATAGVENAESVRNLTGGIRNLGLYVARAGWTVESDINWDALRETIIADRDALPAQNYDSARWAFNKLREAARITAEPWGRVVARDGLVPHAAVKAAVERGDWSGWVDERGRPYVGLLGAAVGKGVGGSGLRAFLAWQDARRKPADLVDLGLPSRARLAPGSEVREAKRRKQGRPDFTRGAASLIQALSALNTAAGFAARTGTDWTAATPEAMLSAAFGRRYADAWCAARGREGDTDAHTLMATLQQLGHYASPFMEAQGHEMGKATLRTESIALLAHAEDFRARQTDDKLATKVRQWGEDGYLKLLALVEENEGEVVALGGNKSLDAQVALLEAGKLKVRSSKEWAYAVRMASMVDTGSRIPARATNLGELERKWIQPADPERPYDSDLFISVPGTETKNKDRLDGYVRFDDADGVRPLSRLIYKLYTLPGGARDILLTLPGKTTPEYSPYLYVADAAQVESKHRGTEVNLYAWVSISTAFQKMINRFGRKVGLSPYQMRYGSKGIHIIRHLFGSFFSVTNLLYAQKMLGHATSQMTQKYYAWVGVKDFSHGQELAKRIAHGAGLRANPAPVLPVSSSEDAPECVECGTELRFIKKAGRWATRCAACQKDQPVAA